MTNHWNRSKDRQLREWRQHCKIYSWAHAKSNEYYLFWNHLLSVISILFSGVGAILTAIAAFLVGDIMTQLSISGAVLCGLGAMILSYLQAFGYESIASSHKETSKEYESIVIQIDSQLSQEWSERADGKAYIEETAEHMIKLATGSVNIPSRIWSAVMKEFKGGGINSPIFSKIHQEPSKKIASSVASVRPYSGSSSAADDSQHTAIDVGIEMPSIGDNDVTEPPPLPQAENASVSLELFDNPEINKYYTGKIPSEVTQAMLAFQLGRFG